MFSNLKLTLASAVAVAALALVPAMAFADEDSDDPGTQTMTAAEMQLARVQSDLQSLVSLSEPTATATVTALPDDNPTHLEASIAANDGSVTYDAPLDSDLLRDLTARASTGSQFTASMDANEVMTDVSSFMKDLQNKPAAGAVASTNAGSDDYGS